MLTIDDAWSIITRSYYSGVVGIADGGELVLLLRSRGAYSPIENTKVYCNLCNTYYQADEIINNHCPFCHNALG